MKYKAIGDRIKARRTELDISAAELAEMLSMSKATIHRYENGDIRNVKLPVAEAIARELKVNVLWLLGKSDRKETEEKSKDDILAMMDAIIERVEGSSTLVSGGCVIRKERRWVIAAALKGVRSFISNIE